MGKTRANCFLSPQIFPSCMPMIDAKCSKLLENNYYCSCLTINVINSVDNFKSNKSSTHILIYSENVLLFSKMHSKQKEKMNS
jgi:hypothetical protein